MKKTFKKNRAKSDIVLDILYWTAGAVVFAMLIATLYMMMGIS